MEYRKSTGPADLVRWFAVLYKGGDERLHSDDGGDLQ